jgi:hypothetical protein
MALGQKNYCLYLTWAASIGLNLSKTDENRRNQSGQVFSVYRKPIGYTKKNQILRKFENGTTRK